MHQLNLNGEKIPQNVIRRSPYEFRKGWLFPQPVLRFIKELIKDCNHPILNVCSGESSIGDIKLDMFTNCDVRGDALALPFKNKSIPTIFCDPPWNMPYDKRALLRYELDRVIADDGELIFNAPWLFETKRLKIKEVWVNRTMGGLPRNINMLMIAHANGKRCINALY